MIQWWFWYATNQFIKKLIILRLLFIYFNYAINQSIIIVHRCLLIPFPYAARRLVEARIPRVSVPVCVVKSVVPRVSFPECVVESVVPVSVVSRCVYTSVAKCVLRRTHTTGERRCVRGSVSVTPCVDEPPSTDEPPCMSGVFTSVPACVIPGTPCVKGAPQLGETTCARKAARVCEPPRVCETPRVSAPAGVVCVYEAQCESGRPCVRKTVCVRSLYTRETQPHVRTWRLTSPACTATSHTRSSSHSVGHSHIVPYSHIPHHSHPRGHSPAVFHTRVGVRTHVPRPARTWFLPPAVPLLHTACREARTPAHS